MARLIPPVRDLGHFRQNLTLPLFLQMMTVSVALTTTTGNPNSLCAEGCLELRRDKKWNQYEAKNSNHDISLDQKKKYTSTEQVGLFKFYKISGNLPCLRLVNQNVLFPLMF